MCVCQVSTEGTVSRGQTSGHSDSDHKCTDFTFTSANDSSSLAHPHLERTRHLREHSEYNCRYCGSEFKDRNHLTFIWLTGKRLCVCQVSTEGTGSRGQTGHSYNGQKCANFTCTSASGSSSLAGPNLARCRHLHARCRCIYCGSEFTSRHQMLHHGMTIHGSMRFVCPQCQRSYVTKEVLKQHVDGMHKKLYRYRCGTCGKGFFVPSLYHDHVAAHTGVKRYTCSICEMRFTNKGTLKTHVLNCHPNEEANIL